MHPQQQQEGTRQRGADGTANGTEPDGAGVGGNAAQQQGVGNGAAAGGGGGDNLPIAPLRLDQGLQARSRLF